MISHSNHGLTVAEFDSLVKHLKQTSAKLAQANARDRQRVERNKQQSDRYAALATFLVDLKANPNKTATKEKKVKTGTANVFYVSSSSRHFLNHLGSVYPVISVARVSCWKYLKDLESLRLPLKPALTRNWMDHCPDIRAFLLDNVVPEQNPFQRQRFDLLMRWGRRRSIL